MLNRVDDESGACANELPIESFAFANLRANQFTLTELLWVTQAVATVAEPPTSDPNTAAIALTIAGSIAYSPLAIWLEPTEDTLTANTRRPRRAPDINQ